MNAKIRLRFAAFSLSFLLLALLSSPTIAQNDDDDTLSSQIGLNYSFTFGFGGESEAILDLASLGDQVYLGGYVNYDVSVEAGPSDRRIITTCYNVSPDYMQGEFADTLSNCGNDGILAKLDVNGSIIWASYFGGPGDEKIQNIASDSEENLIAVGTTTSNNLTTVGAIDSTSDDLGDVFVSKFDPNGAIIWSTYIGGDYVETVYDVLIDSEDNIVILGSTKSSDFPMVNAFDDEMEDGPQLTRMESFITKFTPDGEIVFSSYLGGSDLDIASGVSIDKFDNIIISGVTRSFDFPVRNAEDEVHNGLIDVYLTTISPEGELLQSGFLGGQYLDIITDMKITQEREIIIVGKTNSENFPIVNGADNQINTSPENTVYSDTLIAKFSTQGQIQWSTYLGGDGSDGGKSVSLMDNGNVIITGDTASSDFPVVGLNTEINLNRDTQYEEGDQPSDSYIAVYNTKGEIGYSIYFGGSGVERLVESDYNEVLYMVGESYSGEEFTELNSFNPFESGTIYLSSFDIPETLEFRENPKVDDMNGEQNQLFLENFDLTSAVIVGVIIAIPILRFTTKGVWRLFKKDNEEYKGQIRSYLDNLRSERRVDD